MKLSIRLFLKISSRWLPIKVGIAVLSSLVLAAPVHGQYVVEETITADQPGVDEFFGTAIA